VRYDAKLNPHWIKCWTISLTCSTITVQFSPAATQQLKFPSNTKLVCSQNRPTWLRVNMKQHMAIMYV